MRRILGALILASMMTLGCHKNTSTGGPGNVPIQPEFRHAYMIRADSNPDDATFSQTVRMTNNYSGSIRIHRVEYTAWVNDGNFKKQEKVFQVDVAAGGIADLNLDTPFNWGFADRNVVGEATRVVGVLYFTDPDGNAATRRFEASGTIGRQP